MKISAIEPEFVHFIPADLTEGKLYISMIFATTVHLCACGCRNKVVVPLSPAEWQLYFDGDSVSLTPSIGNWEYPCRSHYWIWRNSVSWSGQWTDEQIEFGRKLDERDLKGYFDRRVRDTPPRPPRMAPPVVRSPAHEQASAPPATARGLGARLGRLLGRG